MRDAFTTEVVADAVMRTLAEAGVTEAFGIPGVHNLALWESARARGDFKIIGVRHEQAAVYAADGAARLSRRAALALTITGPGAANAVGAFGEAAASGSPVVLIATEVARRDRSEVSSFGRVHGSPQQSAIFESLAKGTFRARRASEVTRIVGDAVELAQRAPQGPVYVDIPMDLLSVPYDSSWDAKPATVGADAGPTDLSGLIELASASRKPVLWAGGGAVTHEAAEAVRTLSVRLGAPVITTFAGRGIVAEGHPGWIGLPVHEPEVLALLADSDLLIGLGTAFDGMNTRNWDLPFPPHVVSVNLRPTHLVEEGVPHAMVTGDVTRVVTRLLEAFAARPDRTPWADLPALRDAAWGRLRGTEMQPEAVNLLTAVNAALANGVVTLADMAICGYWTSGYAEPRQPCQLHYPVGWGTLGFAVPAAIGAGAVVRRDGQRVLVVCGDGGFMFAVGELATIREHDLPVTILIVNDEGYGMLRFDQDVEGMPHTGTDLRTPDFAALAAAFGIPASTVDGSSAEELTTALGAGDADSGPQLVIVNAALRPPRTTSPRWREARVRR